ncbi:hypothetical protein H2198_001586 [Neophaeococcomyces mojaviensis]|uniref:Uncharacterized protein n=1 Tax=Neophaeococcomyces mojaviensis TaxID=3383035 RepID=A0ACC3AGG1_9EURO|nr:hypothetical protein H2198_001586 [Knufia sp. JES_112]
MSAGNTRFRSALSPASHSVQTKDPSTINFRQRLSQASPFPKVSSFGLPLTIKQPELRTHNDSVVPVEGGSLIHPRQQSCTEHDLALLFAGIMSYIFGQTVSVNDVSIFLTECQQNHILGVLTCILGIGLYRYIVTRCATTPLAVNQLILEDAYGRIRPFSTDVCMDFDILKKFLEVHYQDTAGPVGAALVKVGQFHVMLGSRRGKVFGRTDWNRNLVKSGYRIVNSVYVNKEDAKCLTCATVMAVTGLGEFHCASCQAYYRDCDTFRPSITQHTRAPLISPLLARPQARQLPLRQAQLPMVVPVLDEEQDLDKNEITEEIEYDVRGLVNIDLRIKPQRRKTSTTKLQKRSKEGLKPASEQGNYDELHSDDIGGKLLQSLRFDGMSAQHIAPTSSTTHEWLFSHEKFVAWIDNSNTAGRRGILWIQGKPGSGKSTIMKPWPGLKEHGKHKLSSLTSSMHIRTN